MRRERSWLAAALLAAAVLVGALSGACKKTEDPAGARDEPSVVRALEWKPDELARLGGLEVNLRVDLDAAVEGRLWSFGLALERHLGEVVFGHREAPDALEAPVAAVREHARFHFVPPDRLRVTTTHPQLAERLGAPDLPPLRDDEGDVLVERVPGEEPFTFRLNATRRKQLERMATRRSAEILRKRLGAFGYTTAHVRQFPGSLSVQVVGARGENATLLVDRLRRRAELSFRLAPQDRAFLAERAHEIEAVLKDRHAPPGEVEVDAAKGRIRARSEEAIRSLAAWIVEDGAVPEDFVLAWGEVRYFDRDEPRDQRRWTLHYLRRLPVLSGRHIDEAKVVFDAQTSEPYVALAFDAVGARQFAQLTRDHVQEHLAIQLDDEVHSVPIVREEIVGGRARITLGRSRNAREAHDEARVLAQTLSLGAHPAPLVVDRVVAIGPAGEHPGVEGPGFLLEVAFKAGDDIPPEHLHARLAPALARAAGGIPPARVAVARKRYVDVEETGELRYVIFVPGDLAGKPDPTAIVGEAVEADPTLQTRFVTVFGSGVAPPARR